MRVIVLLAISAVVSLVWPRAEATSERGTRPVATVAVEPVEILPELPPDELTLAEETEQPSGVEKGPCALHLELFDDATGEFVASKVVLWRVGLPETEDWSAGDQVHACALVPGDHTFEDLPPGRYRLFVHDQRFAVDDPPWFTVEGVLTTIRQAVPMPRSHNAFVRVFKEDGTELKKARISSGSRFSSWSYQPAEWASPRRPKQLWHCRGRGGGRFSSLGCGRISRGFTKPAPGGFELGLFAEDTRKHKRGVRFCVVPRKRSRVSVRVRGDATGPRTYVGLSLSMARLREIVVLPFSAEAARFSASCDAVPFDPARPDAWREIPVEVSVELDGYEKLEFVYWLDDPLAPMALCLKRKVLREIGDESIAIISVD